MGPVSILLVDDNPTFLRILVRFLEVHHQNEVVIVGTAGGGEEALAKVQDLRPQVVLLDLAMPGLSGLEAIPRLRSTLPDVGIIALTLLDPNGYRKAALAAGANEFVAKATLATDLLPAIRRVAQTRRLQERLMEKPGAV
ncbi:MAG: response regulator transcription factor [Chloroflexi bacterium]|nr:response regulator transcription factor [Chloroflexota bacterium]